jgi:hypothetical protein
MIFDLAGHVRLVSTIVDARTRSAIAAELGPYLPTDDGGAHGSPPSVGLAQLDAANPSLDELQLAAGDGLVTGTTSTGLFVLSGDHLASVPDALHDEPAEVRVSAGFPITRLFRQVVRPALQLRALSAGSVAVHSAAVVRDGKAVLVAGWSESGKTETALALAEDGSQFLSDKWTLVASAAVAGADGIPNAAPFPISVGIRRWALPFLPRLRAALPRRASLQLSAAGAAGVAARPLRALPRRGMAGVLAETADRAVALADRAALAPGQIAAAYGHAPIRERVPIGLVIVLRTVPGSDVSAHDGDLHATVHRLSSSALTERQAYFALRQRAAYGLGIPNEPSAVAAQEAARLLNILQAVPIVEVSTPFPVDPRRTVAAVQPWLDAL